MFAIFGVIQAIELSCCVGTVIVFLVANLLLNKLFFPATANSSLARHVFRKYF